MVLSKFDDDVVFNNNELIRRSFSEFLKNVDENIFIRGTNNTTNVEKRYEWGKHLSSILREV